MGWRDRWRRLRRPRGGDAPARGGDTLLLRAADSLRALLDDPSIPGSIRASLAADYGRIEVMLDKLEHGHVHIAVFGRVSVGKSALLNALLGEPAFEVGVLHGTTVTAGHRAWREALGQGVHLIDTPGINELSGEEREALALDVAGRSDLVIFVVDGDMTSVEVDALRLLAGTQRPLLLALNKADRYTAEEREALLARLREHARGLVVAENVIAVMAQPVAQRVLQVQADGREVEIERARAPDVSALRGRILEILESEGKTLAALNAALFAGKLSDEIGGRLTAVRQDLAGRTIRMYCL
ncbi:MAG TPA: Era-like GTP-binding protein, partial [Chiayiivirga sp.]|nr:Era-like GTP-binding protein [Chiayiivirga sp.]